MAVRHRYEITTHSGKSWTQDLLKWVERNYGKGATISSFNRIEGVQYGSIITSNNHVIPVLSLLEDGEPTNKIPPPEFYIDWSEFDN